MRKEIPRGIMSRIPEGMHTRAQVGELIGRSRDTIRRWHESGLYVPTNFKVYGKSKVWLYTDEDVEALKQVAKDTRPGRPRKEDT